MGLHKIDYGVIPVEEIVLDPSETAARLRVGKDLSMPEIDLCLETLRQEANCRYVCVRVPVDRSEEDCLDLGFGFFRSRSLRKNLEGCAEAFIFAVTLGVGVDRLIRKLSLTSPALSFITDALASALAEAVCDRAEEIIKNGGECSRRFSPGYGDLPLEIQTGVLEMLNCGKLMGISLSKQLLMTPSKTITAIMGIKNEN